METDDLFTRLGGLLGGADDAALADFTAARLGVLLADAVWARVSEGDDGPAETLAAALGRCAGFGELDRAAAYLPGFPADDGGAMFAVALALYRAALRGTLAEPDPSARLELLSRLMTWSRERYQLETTAEVQSHLVDQYRALSGPDPDLVRPELAEALVELIETAVEVFDETDEDDPAHGAELDRRLTEWSEELLELCLDLAERGPAPPAGVVRWLRRATEALQEKSGSTVAAAFSARALESLSRWTPPRSAAELSSLQELLSCHVGILRFLDRVDEALRHSQRLLHWYEPLLAADPVVDLRKAAAAFERHAALLTRAGLPHAAVAASERVIDICERAADGSAQGPRERLATALRNHADRLRALGELDAARTPSARAVAVREELHAVPALAQDLGLHSRLLADLRDHEGARAAAERAVAVWKEVAGPHRSFVRYSAALSVLAERLHALGRDEEAVDASMRAVEVAEGAVENTDATKIHLAEALGSLVARLVHAGRHRDALAWSDRELATWAEALGEARADRAGELRARHAEALTNRAIALNHLSRYAESLASTAESVATLRELVEDDPLRSPSLANALFVRQAALASLRRHTEAIDHCRETIAIYEGLDGGDHRRDLADAYRALGGLLGDLRDEDSLAWSNRAVDLAAELAGELGERRVPDLIDAWTNRLGIVQRLGRPVAEMLAASEAAVGLESGLAGRDPVEASLVYANHAICLGDDGRPREALDYTAKAVAAFDGHAGDLRPRGLAQFASCLDRHAVALAGLGRHEEALTFSERAQEICTRLLAADRHLHLPAAAASLDNHAGRFSDLGRHDEAVAHSAAALAMFEELAAGEVVDPRSLSTSIANHANRLVDAGRSAEAVAPSLRVLGMREELAAGGQAPFRELLAISLLNHGHLLDTLGEFAEALAHTGRAVEMLEELAAHGHPGSVELLARALRNRIVYLDRLGRFDDAVDSAARVVELRAGLVAADRGLWLPALAADRENHARRLDRAGRAAEAVDIAGKWVADRRELAGHDPAAQLDELAWAQQFHAYSLRLAGRLAEAGTVAEDAMGTWYRACELDPEQWAEQLAASTYWQAGFQARVGNRERGAERAAEAVDRTRRLVDDGRTELLPELASRGEGLARHRVGVGDRLGAIPAVDAALVIAERLAGEDRAEHAPLLRDVLSVQAWVLSLAARHGAARDASAACLALARELDDPESHRDLAHALDGHAACVAELGDHRSAIALSEEALVLWEGLGGATDIAWSHRHRALWSVAAGGDPAAALALSERGLALMRGACGEGPGLRDELGETLREHARRLTENGRDGEARDACAEALEHFEELAREFPAVHRPALAETLRTAAELATASDPERAVELAARAVELLGVAEEAEPGVFTAKLAEARSTLAGAEVAAGR
ncbi:hypothetical protein AB0I28_00860 [Phytomonospora sp. NPDC050363]|uniref:hypothetical protein n=1 Tax=Phytomonospora sp. NPDC050363 TaxID=3155642 RepID=UPI0033E97F52